MHKVGGGVIIRSNEHLSQQLTLLKQRLESDSATEWQDVTDFRIACGETDTRDTVRKGGKIINEYLEAGWSVTPPDNQNLVATRILSLSDFHVPFQLPVSTFENYIGKVDILQINGDVGDCQAISKFSKAYRVSPMEELIETRKYLIDVIDFIKPRKVVVTYGNHDLRFQNYFANSLDTDILELMPKTSLELILEDGFKHYNKRERIKIEYKPLCEVISDIEIEYADNWFCQIGKTIFCHPLAFNSGIMKTAENAMSYFRNENYMFTSLVMAHTHRVGEYVVGNTTLYEQGCCCDTKQNNYGDGRLTRSQKEGFLYIAQDIDGNVIRDKTRLVCLN